jgi:hypothetical protein
METPHARTSKSPRPPATLSGDGGSPVHCPRCGRAAMLYLEHGMNVYEHRAGQADETREVCILP